MLHIELYDGKELMRDKDYVTEFGATTATCLRLSRHWKGSGRIWVADSWFGGVESAKQLMIENGLYSIQLVKTNHKNYPVALLGETELERGEWNAATANTDGIELLAVKYKDLQDKQFISTCSIISTTLTNQT